MRKVVIVDDEIWIRRGLIQSIPWERFGLKLVGEASNGEEAHAIALAEKPDLLFLDMRMPGLDGKQLIGMLNRDLPELLTIVVSGYSDFEYTKEAIRHKAFEYLLKPVKKEELVQVLEKAAAELDRRESEKRRAPGESPEDRLQRMLHHAEAEPRDGEGLSHTPPDWWAGEARIVVLQPDAYGDNADPAKLLPLIREQLERNRPFLFGGQWSYVVTTAPDAARETVLAVTGQRLKREDFDKLCRTLQAALKQAGINGCSFGVSGAKTDAQQAGRAYVEAVRALKTKSLGERNAVLFAGSETNAAPPCYPRELEDAFLLSLQMGSESAAHDFNRLFAAFSAPEMTVDHMQRSATVLIHSVEKQLRGSESRLEDVCGQSPLAFAERIRQINDAASVKGLFAQELIPPLLAYGKRSSEKQGEKIVRDIQKLIETHYDRPLSLHQIAESHYMNTDYLSRLFKKTTGHNFVDYMTDYRIGKSKQLMKHAKYKNYEIAQMVGYEDYRYFSQIFKKRTGMTIGEYRSKEETAPPLMNKE